MVHRVRFDQLIFDEIIRRLTLGETLKAICATSHDYPRMPKFSKWLDENPALKPIYSAARVAQAQLLSPVQAPKIPEQRLANGFRPVEYDEQVFMEILERIASGIILPEVCVDPALPTVRRVNRWLLDDPVANERYLAARALQADAFADQIVQLADDTRNADPDIANWSKMQIDARKWTAARLRPQRWGERVQTEITGADGGPVTTEIVYTVHDPVRTAALTLVKNRDAADADMTDITPTPQQQQAANGKA